MEFRTQLIDILAAFNVTFPHDAVVPGDLDFLLAAYRASYDGVRNDSDRSSMIRSDIMVQVQQLIVSMAVDLPAETLPDVSRKLTLWRLQGGADHDQDLALIDRLVLSTHADVVRLCAREA